METGDMLPPLTLVLADGAPIDLADRHGRGLVLYFYPKADTTGCTREAQEFSQLSDAFDRAGVDVVGVSRDAPARLAKFAAKYALTVRLASDEDGTASAMFGTWVEKQMYGRRYMGVERATFRFDAGGRLVRSWRKVRVPGHAAAVFESIADTGRGAISDHD